jgi:hypothetical protein
MQPTYLPWCGYFGLMHAVDVFVLLDSVQFARRSWQQRNQIKATNGVQWLSVPVLSKGKRDQLISEVEVDKSANFASTHRKTIEMSYAKTPFFKAYADELLPLLDNPSPRLSDLTISLILRIKSQLGITTQVLSCWLRCAASLVPAPTFPRRDRKITWTKPTPSKKSACR